jgi:hypothetical protein
VKNLSFSRKYLLDKKVWIFHTKINNDMQKSILYTFIILLSGLSACDYGPYISNAVGVPYEIVVVTDKNIWDGNIGGIIKEELTAPVPYLQQAEASMKISYITPDDFRGLNQYSRNILLINSDKTKFDTFKIKKANNKWANNQAILSINSPDLESIESSLYNNPGVILDYFSKEEMIRAKEQLAKTHSMIVYDKAKQKFNISIFVPEEINSFKENQNCLWFSNNATEGRSDFLIYSFLLTDSNTFTLDYLVSKRDSVIRNLVRGFNTDISMTTDRSRVAYIPSTYNGKYCGILHGIWQIGQNNSLNGPFVSYTRVDEENNKVIVTEGFVFEPYKEKSNYIRNIEACLQTVLFPGEHAAD